MSILAHLKNLFIPHEENNFRAKFLHHSSLTNLLVIFLVFQVFLSGFSKVQPAVLGFASQIAPEKVIELTNVERAKVGAPPLKLNQTLVEAAQMKAGDMFAFNYWAHTSPSGRDPWAFFKQVGYGYLYAGENLARDFSSPNDIVAAWLASPSHRENLLNPKYQEIGVAVVDGTLSGVPTTLIVQLFGTPTQAPAKVSEQAASIPQAEVIPVNIVREAPVLSQATGQEKNFVNPFLLTRQVSLAVLGFLIAILMLDGLIIFRKKTVRLTGRSLAHTLFLFGMILVVYFSRSGRVI